jgi:CHASE2 domain-containing sensor protein
MFGAFLAWKRRTNLRIGLAGLGIIHWYFCYLLAFVAGLWLHLSLDGLYPLLFGWIV